MDDKAGDALAALYKDLEVEEREEREERQCNGNEDEDKPLNAWEEYGEVLTDKQREEHDASVQPVRSTLVKVVIGY